jgi:hypothetical protein
MSLVVSHPLRDATITTRRWRYHAAWLAASLAVLGLALVLQVPSEFLAIPGMARPLPEICLSRRLLGLDCPGCGLTRCFVALAHGDIVRAWRFNPAGLFWFAATVWQIPYRATQLCLLYRGRELAVRRSLAEGVLLALMLACLAQWAVRHLARWL